MTQAESWTVGRLLQWTTDFLRKHASESPRLDAEVLLAHARGCQRIELYTAFAEEPPEEIKTRFRELVKKRAAGEPVAYLVGTKEFFSLPFQVTRDVLIPRPETEHLVVAVLDLLKSQQEKNQLDGGDIAAAEGAAAASPATKEISLPVRIADLGTGSGCIAITLAKHLPKATITAVDRSEAALEIARRNAQTHGVADRIDFRQSDWLSAFSKETDAHWDIIVSNPPYISQSEFEKLNKSVRDFEPTGALVSGPEGTEDIRKLAEQSSRHLVPGGYLLVELSPMIATQVQAILSTPPWSYVRTIKDLAHLARIAVACYQPDSTPSG